MIKLKKLSAIALAAVMAASALTGCGSKKKQIYSNNNSNGFIR